MLYLNFIQNREEFILDREKSFPYWIQKILYFVRKIRGQPLQENIEGKTIISLSRFNARVAKKLDKIFKIEVTKNVCICDSLLSKEDFMRFIASCHLKVMDGKWLFRYLVPNIATFICQKLDFLPETR